VKLVTKRQIVQLKWAKYLNRHFSKKSTNTEKDSQHYVREVYNTTTIRYHFTFTRPSIVSIDKDVEKLKSSYTPGRNVKWYILLGK
jgi:hypothetical protein